MTMDKTSFELGEDISVTWKADPNHSTLDWIGIYRFGANPSNIATNMASFDRWVYVDSPGLDSGRVVFSGSRLPWRLGSWELRYHHNEKYAVVCSTGPFEVKMSDPLPLHIKTSDEEFTKACQHYLLTTLELLGVAKGINMAPVVSD